MENNTKKMTLFALTWPIFIEIFLHMLMGNVNTMMLGNYSDDAVAAVGVTTQVLGILIVIFGFVATGTSILVAQYLGAGQAEDAKRSGLTAIMMNTLFGIAISLLLVASGGWLLEWLHLEPRLMSEALLYMNVVGGFLFIEAIMMTVSAILRAHGYTKWVMFVTVGMNAANLFGCWLVLYQPFGMPVLGVSGVATVIVVSRFLGLIGVLVVLQLRVRLNLPRLQDIKELAKKYVNPLLKIGIPSAGEHLSYHSSQLLITFFVTLIGTMALTTKVYVQNVGLFLFLFSAAIGMGTQILVGHMVGAGEMEAAYRRCLRSLKIAIAISLSVSVLIAWLAPSVFPLFTSDAEIIALASAVMLWGVVLEPGRCFNLVIINSLRAAGDTRFPVMIGILSMWGVSVPLAWWLGVHLEMGLIGVYLSFIVDEWLRGLIMLWRWRSRVWQSMSFVSKS
jgi:putative MATE family efflux protein